MSAISQERESPCTSLAGLERSFRDSTVAKIQVHGHGIHCERGGLCIVSIGNRIQAEVSLSPAPSYLGFFLSLCSLSPSSDPFNQSSIPLLVNGCPAAKNVSLPLAPPAQCTPRMKNFTFRLGPFYNHSIQFLHCHVVLCTRESVLCHDMDTERGPNLPKCPISDGPCTSSSPLATKTEAPYTRTVTQPLIVTIPVASHPLVPPRDGKRSTWILLEKGQQTQGVSLEAVIGITLCSFVIGVTLTAGLWFIHSKTGKCL
ncbi:hypothetical protein GDO86_006840, partial [Hymenochirus boettgeri]